MNAPQKTRFTALVFITTLICTSLALAHEPVDKTRLPVGDGKYSNAPKAGYVWVCSTRFGGGGAQASGDWMRQDGTFDFTKKPIVEGAVQWPSRFKIEILGNKRVITSNDLPAHPTGIFPVARGSEAYQYDRNPNSIRAQDFRLELPLTPELAEPSCLGPGAIGFLTSGAVFFNALDARGDDAVANEIQDSCQGHPERQGNYHYHSLSTCLEPDQATSKHSELVGYALDGFGIYGRYGENGKEMRNQDLDECHGHTHEVNWDGKKVSIYHYHASWEYPYTVGCYRGKPQRIAGAR